MRAGCRRLSTALALLLAAGALRGQPKGMAEAETERAGQLLHSHRLADRAWGVYYTARLRGEDAGQELTELLRPAKSFQNSPSYTEEYAFLAVLFDGLIEAGATVPVELLESFEEKWADPVVILAARNPDNEEFLLRLRREESPDMVWLAANNLLFGKKSQRWYAATLSEIAIEHRFTVTDPGRGMWGGGMGGSSFCGLAGPTRMAEGFPPVVLYTLTATTERGNVLLAAGPENAYYRRTSISPDQQAAAPSGRMPVSRMQVRIGYMAQLGNKSHEEIGHVFQVSSQLSYVDRAQFAREVERSLRAQEQEIRTLLKAIAGSGPQVPDLTLRIVPIVEDAREAPKEALPPVAAREFSLR